MPEPLTPEEIKDIYNWCCSWNGLSAPLEAFEKLFQTAPSLLEERLRWLETVAARDRAISAALSVALARIAELEKEREQAPHSRDCPSEIGQYGAFDAAGTPITIPVGPCGPPCWKAVKKP